VVKNRIQINGYANQSEIFVDSLNLAVDGTKSVIVKLISNPTTLSADTTADYTDSQLFGATNLLVTDIKTASYTGGKIIGSYVIPKDGGLSLDFSGKELYLTKDDTLIVTAQSATSNTISLAMGFIGDI
jgi:hypothetical protein